jgi:hypothetical protein
MRGRRQDWRQAATRGDLVAAEDTNINVYRGVTVATRGGDNLSPSLFDCSTRRRNSCPYQELQPATSWRPIGDKTPPLSIERG